VNKGVEMQAQHQHLRTFSLSARYQTC